MNSLEKDSLQKRYFHKLRNKIVGIPINFITAAIVPRGLGIDNYGNFSFITDFFTKFVNFIDSGTSTCLYSKLSKKPEEVALMRFYRGYFVIGTLLMFLILAAIFLINEQNSIWVGQKTIFIWLGFLWGILNWANSIVQFIVDAYGLTVESELAAIKQKFIGLCILGLIFFLGKINLFVFFIYNLFMFLVMLFLWWKVLKKNNVPLIPEKKLGFGLTKKYSKEFYNFSAPLFVGIFFAFLVGFADRWLLQIFAGSYEQGLYSLSFKVGSLCFLFTHSLTPLFHREIYKAHGEGKPEEMRRLFLRFVPMFYSIAVCISVFFSFQSNNVMVILGGESFKGASVVPIALMSLSPIHQTYGQLNSAVYFALGRTALYRNIGVIMKIFGLGLVYFLLAPTEKMGLNMGSTGLALKMVLVQIVAQNVLLWYNTKFLKISFIKMLMHQIISIFIIGSVARASTYLANYFIKDLILSFLIAGVFYLVLLIGVLFFLPKLFSTSNDEIFQQITTIKKRFSQ